MSQQEGPDWRDDFLDAAEHRRLMNELLVAIFLPAAFSFVACWVVVRLYLDAFLRSLGLPRLAAHPLPFIALESGGGRYLLLVVVGTVVVCGYLWLYLRYLRPPLKARGVV